MRQARCGNLGLLLAAAAAVLVNVPAPDALASGYTLKTLYSFCVQSGCADGQLPSSGVVKDTSGTLFGMAYEGGKDNAGTTFSLTPKGGAYKFKLLYSFCSKTNCTDGAGPLGQLIEDTKGNLYGVTGFGGAQTEGTIFRLAPGKPWKHNVLYSFCSQTNCTDGSQSYSGLSYQGQAAGEPWDGKSPLFGSTSGGGTKGNGTIFEFTPNGSQWDYTVIHNIQVGSDPNPVLVDQNGNLFITSQGGGANNAGNFYTLANGTWKETTIHNFCAEKNCPDGWEPMGTLALDAAGNVYGVTFTGGSGGNGVLFEHPASGGFAVLYTFCGDGSCGVGPTSISYGNVSGNLFGGTYYGGANEGGIVFALTPKNGTWKESVIADFCPGGNCASGANPDAPVSEDAQGNLFSTAFGGGNVVCNGGAGCGTVFELKKSVIRGPGLYTTTIVPASSPRSLPTFSTTL